MIKKIGKRVKYDRGIKFLAVIKKDPRGSISWVLDNINLTLLSYFSTLYCYGSAWAWGIEIGQRNLFWGTTQFRKFPLSQIKISSGCRFRSNIRSNFVGLNHPCCISTHSKAAVIRIGSECGFSANSISAFQSVNLGYHVLIGANTMITDFDWHEIDPANRMLSEPVVIEDRVWIGANCAILKGVHIGHDTIIGANSVVTHCIPENVIAAGNPARVIKKRFE